MIMDFDWTLIVFAGGAYVGVVTVLAVLELRGWWIERSVRRWIRRLEATR